MPTLADLLGGDCCCPAYFLLLNSVNERDPILHVLTLFILKVRGLMENSRRPLLFMISNAFPFAVTCIISPAVIFGRLYLFIESFLRLRGLPWGSFESTPWENYWPHF